MTKRKIIEIRKDNVRLLLSVQRSKVRIADSDGNHANKPTIVKNIVSNYVEWMISNEEIKELIDQYLSSDDKRKLTSRINQVNMFLNKSEYATREAKKTTPLGKFGDFNIYKYEESFFSFEKVLNLNIKVRITFKMGDFTLAPHMFILFPFNKIILDLFNREGSIADNDYLGSGCFALWKPSSDVICEAVESLAHASEGHKRDLLAMVE
jgi:hypothetical protein